MHNTAWLGLPPQAKQIPYPSVQPMYVSSPVVLCRLPPSVLRLQQEAAGENSLQSEASTASLGMADVAAAGGSAWSTSAAAGGAAPAPLGASRASSQERGLPRGEPMDQTPRLVRNASFLVWHCIVAVCGNGLPETAVALGSQCRLCA